MGILFLFLGGIVAIIIVAKLASKVRPEEERMVEEKKAPKKTDVRHLEEDLERFEKKLDAVVGLLLKKKILSEEEMHMEIKEAENKEA